MHKMVKIDFGRNRSICSKVIAQTVSKILPYRRKRGRAGQNWGYSGSIVLVFAVMGSPISILGDGKHTGHKNNDRGLDSGAMSRGGGERLPWVYCHG